MFRIYAEFFRAMLSGLIPFLVTHTWKTTVAVPGLSSLPADPPLLVNGDYAVEVEIAVGAGATNVEVDVGAVVASKIQSIVINADKAPMDVFTNAADGTGGQHFTLAANKSLAWNNSMTFSNPVTVNITKFFANNSSLTAGTLRVGILLNS